MNKIIFILFILISLTSCSNQPVYKCSATTNISVDLKKLLNSSDTVVDIEGNKFKFSVNLSKDETPVVHSIFKPYSTRNRCLNGLINIYGEKDNIKLPLSYKVKTIWLINNDEVWEISTSNYALQDNIKVDGGPEWSSDNNLRALIKIEDSNGKYFFIKSEDVTIILTI